MRRDGTAQLREELVATLPVPGDVELIWLLEALQRIVDVIGWARPYLGPAGSADVIGALREEVVADLSAQSDDDDHPEPVPMGGVFGLADAVIGTGKPEQPLGIQSFRALLWVAVHACHNRGVPYQSRAMHVASALRSVAWRPNDMASHALDSHLIELGRQTSITGAIAVLDRLTQGEHKTLHEAWCKWLRPTLEEVIVGYPTPPVEELPKHPVGSDRSDTVPEPDGEIEYFPLLPRVRKSGQPRHEPSAELTPAVHFVLVPGYGTGTLCRRQAEYRARQAIWGRNYLLLPEHVEAMFPDVFGAAVRALVKRLEVDEPEDVVAVAACLLMALTGRSIRAFATLQVAPVPPQKLNESDWYLDLEGAVIASPVYWKQPVPQPEVDKETGQDVAAPPSYFQPTQEQRSKLCPVSDFVVLPTIAQVRRVLVRHRPELDTIRSIPAPKLRQRMATVVAGVADEVGIPITVARLRAGLGPLVMEACRDLAMAQLICSDSFGRPSAHQHYYSPRRTDIAAVYLKAIRSCFGGEAQRSVARGGTRVGSELLVDAAAAKQLASASFEWKRQQLADATGLARIVIDHQRILDHLVRMLLATTGHRWASSLFTLKLGDFDLSLGAALFADKRHDVAHDPRLVALPKIVCEQIRSYIRHVVALADLFPQLADVVTRVLRGDDPLFFDLRTDAGRLEMWAPTVDVIGARGPPEWRQLPEYWGRTYIRTRAIEMGAPAFFVACQLGHYDSVGYPYSNQSPTEPVDVLARMRPWLDRVAATQRWSIVKAEVTSGAGPADRAEASITGQYSPLRDWRASLHAADHRAADVHRKWEVALRTGARAAREAAEKVVLAHPVIVESRIAAAYADESAAADVPTLATLDLHRVRSDLLVDCGDDDGLALARLRAFRHILGVVAKRSHQPPPDARIPIAVRRPLDNAFVPGACLGLSQVGLLREHVRERAKAKHPQRSFELQVARTAEALALYGGVDDPETSMELLTRRGQARPSAKIPDLLLVPLAAGRAVALRGVAALALANLARQFPDRPLPAVGEVESTLATLLPAWATLGGTANLLARLCSTVAVANRFEYSPAARFALDPERGSVSASIDEQLAFIDGDPVGPVRAPAAIPPPVGPKIIVRRQTHAGRAMAQYKTLVAMIPTVGKAFRSPVAGRLISAVDVGSQPTREVIVGDLANWLDESDSGQRTPLWSVVRMLGEWTKSELLRLKPNGELLAYRSVKTYLTRIGRALTQELGELDAARWTERVVEDAYEYALEASDDVKFKVAASLLSFHRCVEVRFDLPDVDLSLVYAQLAAGERHVNADMILPIERHRAFDAIAAQAWSNPNGAPAMVEIARQADAIAPFLGYAGARLSEPMGMQVRDVGRRPDGELWARIRSNRLRSLKTAAATRVALFGPAHDEAHLERCWQWVQAVRKTAGTNRPEGVYIISAADTRNDLGQQGEVAKLIRAELARATHRPSERLHRLRHSVATERIFATAVSREDAEWLGLPANPIYERVLQPRDFHAISVPMGHAHWMTTIQWYLHLPWVLQSRAATRLREEYFERHTVAGILGVTLSQMDTLLRGTDGDRVTIWFDSVRDRRVIPEVPEASGCPVAAAPSSSWKWTVRGVAELVADTRRAHDLVAPLVRQGIPLAEADHIADCAARWERKLGLRLIPESIGGKVRECPGRAIRRLASDAEFEPIWDAIDGADAAQRQVFHDLVADFFSYLTPRSGDEILLTSTRAEVLCDLLVRIGIAADDITVAACPGALSEVSLSSNGTGARELRGRGRGLKRVLVIIGLALALQAN